MQELVNLYSFMQYFMHAVKNFSHLALCDGIFFPSTFCNLAPTFRKQLTELALTIQRRAYI
ncbi:MAG: hypothetical protein RR416_03470 [Clostridia bacterium]